MIRKLLFGAVVALLLISLGVTGVTVRWAWATVQTAETQLQIEQQNIEALRAHAEITKWKLDESHRKGECRALDTVTRSMTACTWGEFSVDEEKANGH